VDAKAYYVAPIVRAWRRVITGANAARHCWDAASYSSRITAAATTVGLYIVEKTALAQSYRHSKPIYI